MGLERTLVLGLIAGGTILLGLPVGRVRRPMPGVRQFLNAAAVGVLLFLVWDVLSAAWEPLDARLAGDGPVGPVVGYGVLFATGLAAGLLGLVAYERWMARRSRRSRFGPGAMDVRELSAGRRLALLIAVGIGLHNFAEGLAIGQSAATGEVALATLLVIGFAAHNATEGFGIVAPLAADDDRPSWTLLLGLGLLGGGPTFVGTWIGHGFTSEPLSVLFLTLAAGSILYVVIQLLGPAARGARTAILAYGLLAGLLAGFATDAIVSAAGA
jgi:zinc transporter, ZIP family